MALPGTQWCRQGLTQASGGGPTLQSWPDVSPPGPLHSWGEPQTISTGCSGHREFRASAVSSWPGIQWVWLLAAPPGCQPSGTPRPEPPRGPPQGPRRPTIGPLGACTYEGGWPGPSTQRWSRGVEQHRHQGHPFAHAGQGAAGPCTEDGGVSLPRLSQPGRRRRAHGVAGGLLDDSAAAQTGRGRREEGLAHRQSTLKCLPVSPGQQAAQRPRGRGRAHHVDDRGHQGEEQEG